MSDTKDLVKAIAESVPLKEAYEDVAQPAARQAGEAIAQVGALVNSALRPLRTLQLSWNTIFNRLDGWLVDKLSGVPPDEISEPSPNVVGGVVTGLLFVQEEAALRDMFVQLLATGMTKSGSHLAHPAFAEFIKQMTPLEARLVRAMSRHGDIATVTIRAHDKADGDVSKVHPNRSLTSADFVNLLDDPPSEGWVDEVRLTAVDVPTDAPPTSEVATAFGNLERLALVKASTEITFTDTTRYLKIAMSERAMQIYDRVGKGDALAGLHPGMLSVTDLGKRFIGACLPRRKKGAG